MPDLQTPTQSRIEGQQEPAREYPEGNELQDEPNSRCSYCLLTEKENGEEVHVYETGEDGEIVAHEDCFAEEYVYIDSRSDYYHMDDIVFVENHGEHFHIEDTFCCEDCGEAFWINDNHHIRGGTYDGCIICDYCATNGDYAWPEDSPDYLYHIDDLHWCDREECWFLDADNANCGNDGPLQAYSTDVLRSVGTFAYLDNGRITYNFADHLLFGIELETDSRGDHPEDIARQFCESTNFQDVGICKEDGSISGIELCTIPATLAAHRSKFNWSHWSDVLRPIARGYYGNAGMHVHINRAAISQLTLGKMLVFCNDLGNSEFLSMIAQRDVTQSQWCGLNPSSFDKVGKAAKSPHAGKYSILNVTSRTIECRMFNSSLVASRIYKNIEFCHALVQFCINTSARQLQASYFRAYVETHKTDYPELYQFITDRSEA